MTCVFVCGLSVSFGRPNSQNRGMKEDNTNAEIINFEVQLNEHNIK